MFKVGTFAIGSVIGSWHEVAVKLELVQRRVKAAEDCVDQGPKVSRVFEGGLKNSLSTRGKFSIGSISQEVLKGVEVLDFMIV